LYASCNGFQHLTLFIDYLSLSKELNEFSWNDKDFYNFIAVINFLDKKLDDYKRDKLELSNKDKESYNKLVKLDIIEL
jgi:hypothetical protein